MARGDESVILLEDSPVEIEFREGIEDSVTLTFCSQDGCRFSVHLSRRDAMKLGRSLLDGPEDEEDDADDDHDL
jgi:hypothetical protein